MLILHSYTSTSKYSMNFSIKMIQFHRQIGIDIYHLKTRRYMNTADLSES